MICGMHKDGRIILMAKEFNLKPMILFPQSGKWELAKISGEELNDFVELENKSAINLFLYGAITFAETNVEFLINK